MNWHMHKDSWSFILKRYLPRLLLLSLAWEILQLPLYTLASEPRAAWVAYAIAHCTVGDAMIGTAALVGALTICQANEPARWPRAKIVVWMALLTVSYTILSERYNVAHGSWAYSLWMPIIPLIGVGLSPLLQWLLIPIAAWRWAQNKKDPCS
ncbi:hypothetical protein [Ralstonia pickettii]|jgi:MFS family permease|uniref:Rod shape-determining protein MreD n=1 Tax=Ralstonia pickettii TaxID=329 RepID=A0ABM9ILC5_RALPI|nr:hypothetical protein [Ralstonia pickettii]CAJ0723269.1 hypothetical protein R38712_01817 [Ralstonia pickettii]